MASGGMETAGDGRDGVGAVSIPHGLCCNRVVTMMSGDSVQNK